MEVVERHAVVVCDAQSDHLASLPQDVRGPVVRNVSELLTHFRRNKWAVVFTGLRFESGYPELPERHRLYGGLKRLNAKQGDSTVHWFMNGFAGADIDESLAPTEDSSVSHMSSVETEFSATLSLFRVWSCSRQVPCS